MQRNLLQRYPNLLIRIDSTSKKIHLKKNRELEEITFKNVSEGHDAYKMLCLRSGRKEVLLDLELVLLISPFLSRLTGELRACCHGPHDQVNISLHQFPLHLLHLLKRLLETGECIISSETEMKDLEGLIQVLQMDLTCFVGNSGPTAGKNEADLSEYVEDMKDLNGSIKNEKKIHEKNSSKDKALEKQYEIMVISSDDDLDNEDNRVEPKTKCTKFKNIEKDEDISERNQMSLTPSLRDSCSSSSQEESTLSPSSSLVEPLSPWPIGLNVGDMAYAMHQNDEQEFKKCQILGKQENARVCTYEIRFEGSHTKSRNASTTSTVIGSQLAYFEPSQYGLSAGTRCIAIYCEEPGHSERFFPAIVAESPNVFNDNRYLIFFDDGYNAYLHREDLREVVEPLTKVWEDGPCDPEFINDYLEKFPNNMVYHLVVDEQVETYLSKDDVWVKATVLEVDASLAKMGFGDDYEPEWIYIGSPRLKPISDKSKNIKNAGEISKKIKIVSRNSNHIKATVIDDPSATANIAYGKLPKTKKRVRTFRKCPGWGGKLPREEIKSKPLRKTLNSQSKMGQ